MPVKSLDFGFQVGGITKSRRAFFPCSQGIKEVRCSATGTGLRYASSALVHPLLAHNGVLFHGQLSAHWLAASSRIQRFIKAATSTAVERQDFAAISAYQSWPSRPCQLPFSSAASGQPCQATAGMSLDGHISQDTGGIWRFIRFHASLNTQVREIKARRSAPTRPRTLANRTGVFNRHVMHPDQRCRKAEPRQWFAPPIAATRSSSHRVLLGNCHTSK